VVDLEFDAASGRWVDRFASGLDTLRVRTAVYPDGLGRVVGEGRRTGDAWDGGGGLLTMGPLKVITDGSLGTRTAHCCEPYPGALAGDAPHGKQNVPPEELHDLLATATGHGLRVALHAIGDAAVAIALRAFEATGARGSIEHAQLTTTDQIATMARLGVRASVQPAHLLEDRDLVPRCWPGREDRCFRLRSMLDAGVDVALGSDAPVSPLDPWLEMAVAVHRSGDDRPPWVPGQAITAAEALAASTDGWGTVAAGHPADLVALDRDPLGAPVDDTAAAAALLRDVPVALTLVAGRTVHDAR
ncbi:MAG TPA: amidohydrolase family protein, partial [Segeticoccus sp.]|nr:amidohydrolase family protein [Segeticoccus sp.]